jgi:hypothetical protein
VLHVLDGLVATWEGGPKTDNKTFATWPCSSLLFATDPVALDHVGWEIIDRKRAAEGWPGVAQMGLDARTGIVQIDGKPYPEELYIRQPQHIPLAKTLGLGGFDRTGGRCAFGRNQFSQKAVLAAAPRAESMPLHEPVPAGEQGGVGAQEEALHGQHGESNRRGDFRQ